MSAPKSVEEFRAGLDGPTLATVDRLRQLAADAGPAVTEHLKWNAPSFCVDGDDRITLGLDRKGGVRLVLHRGVRPRDPTGFRFEDPYCLVHWAAPDRGVLTFTDPEEVEAQADALRDLFRRWIEATR